MNDVSPDDSDDVARLFRDNDDIGSDSSVWLRPLRQLLKDGKPLGQLLALTVSSMDESRLPLGMLSQTKKDRLIFWPVLPSGKNMICGGEPVDSLDHITLEFPSEKIHVTAYGATGKPIHTSRAWRVYRSDDRSVALWFLLLLRLSVLREQDMAVQRRVKAPASDKERRIGEFIDLRQRLKFLNVPLPPHNAEQDYIYSGFYLAPDSIMPDNLGASILPVNASLDSQIEGWSDKSRFTIGGLRFTLGGRVICVATACPPGKLLSDVSVGFPRRGAHETTEHGSEQ